MATAWGSTRERRWKSREERAIDARMVLADGANTLADLTWKLQQIKMNRAIGKALEKADLEEVEDLLGPRALRVTGQIALRYGVDARETQTFSAWSVALRDVLPIVAAQHFDENAYKSAWQRVVAEEKAHFATTARLLA